MATSIFLIGQDNALTELTQAPYDSEELLQRLLADHPSLLRGTSASDARLLLICRELGIPDEHAGTDRWAIDHLFVDREGVPVLVEVKRASDTRSRREVVAQMLDYAANSVAYLPIDRIVSLYAKSAQELGKDRDALLAEFLEDGDAESFRRRVEANLRAGRVRLVFVADRIPTSLRRIVEFLNEQMRPARGTGARTRSVCDLEWCSHFGPALDRQHAACTGRQVCFSVPATDVRNGNPGWFRFGCKERSRASFV